jgi:hypothetical protein
VVVVGDAPQASRQQCRATRHDHSGRRQGGITAMDRAALQRRLQEAENTVQRAEESIAFQRWMIAMLDRSAHDVMAQRCF